jgi:AraC-like DNA-binding protein
VLAAIFNVLRGALALIDYTSDITHPEFALTGLHVTSVLRMHKLVAALISRETDVPLTDVGLLLECADQSHGTALFRTHVSLTPKAYRARTGDA